MATLHRAFSGAIFGVLFCLGLFFNRTQPLVPWIVSIATAIGTLEFYKLAEKKDFRAQGVFGCLIGLWLVIEAYHIGLVRLPLIMTVALLGSFILQLFRNGLDKFIAHVSVTFAGCFYVSLPMAMAMDILHGPEAMDHSRYLLLFVIVTVWSADVGAYFVGRKWGRTPLAPVLSPKKTFEGLAGGCAATFVTAAVFMLFPAYASTLRWVEAMSLALVFCFIGLAGDLAASGLKRDAGVKDSGLNVTGHGGMLDIVDSLLFCFPVFYLHFKHIHPMLHP